MNGARTRRKLYAVQYGTWRRIPKRFIIIIGSGMTLVPPADWEFTL